MPPSLLWLTLSFVWIDCGALFCSAFGQDAPLALAMRKIIALSHQVTGGTASGVSGGATGATLALGGPNTRVGNHGAISAGAIGVRGSGGALDGETPSASAKPSEEAAPVARVMSLVPPVVQASASVVG